MKFIKPYDDVKGVPTPCGDTTETTYTQFYDKKGHPYLEPSGKRNLQEIVRSNKDICNYRKIIKRYLSTGDESLLHQRAEGLYLDLTEFAGDLMEAQNILAKAQEVFRMLPAKDRASYNNSYREFVADFANEKFMKAIGLYKESEVMEIASEQRAESSE